MDGLKVGEGFTIGAFRYKVVSNDGNGDCKIELVNKQAANKKENTEPEPPIEIKEDKLFKTKQKG